MNLFEDPPTHPEQGLTTPDTILSAYQEAQEEFRIHLQSSRRYTRTDHYWMKAANIHSIEPCMDGSSVLRRWVGGWAGWCWLKLELIIPVLSMKGEAMNNAACRPRSGRRKQGRKR